MGLRGCMTADGARHAATFIRGPERNRRRAHRVDGQVVRTHAWLGLQGKSTLIRILAGYWIGYTRPQDKTRDHHALACNGRFTAGSRCKPYPELSVPEHAASACSYMRYSFADGRICTCPTPGKFHCASHKPSLDSHPAAEAFPPAVGTGRVAGRMVPGVFRVGTGANAVTADVVVCQPRPTAVGDHARAGDRRQRHASAGKPDRTAARRLDCRGRQARASAEGRHGDRRQRTDADPGPGRHA